MKLSGPIWRFLFVAPCQIPVLLDLHVCVLLCVGGFVGSVQVCTLLFDDRFLSSLIFLFGKSFPLLPFAPCICFVIIIMAFFSVWAFLQVCLPFLNGPLWPPFFGVVHGLLGLLFCWAFFQNEILLWGVALWALFHLL